ncbi:MAG: hypothetical protein HPY65_06615 [Syntrophaceae bacterium]|nr:hypothetical protein [Syntrophaceae bacterium]
MNRAERLSPLGEAGFTLVEILVVFVLMCLILGISTVLFADRLPGARQKAAAREIVATLRYAKNLAVSGKGRQVVELDLDARSYVLKGREKKLIPEEIRLVIHESDVKAGAVEGGQYQIRFDARGGNRWDRISLERGGRIIEIKSDPVRTAFISEKK